MTIFPDLRTCLWVLCLLLLPLLLASCSIIGEERAPASDFEVELFDGGAFRLSEAAGKQAIVLNFWFPSCPPCRAEMPSFEEAWQEVQDEEVRFLGLFVPMGFDSEQDARDFVQELGLTYDFATDTRAEITRAYELLYFPTTIFIDKSGRIFKTELSTLDADKITQIVREMAQG